MWEGFSELSSDKRDTEEWSNPCRGLEKPLDSRRLRIPEFLNNRHIMVAISSALHTGRPHPPPRRYSWYSFLYSYNGYRVFPGGKAAGAWRWPPTPPKCPGHERVGLYLYSPSGPSWPVIGRTLYPLLIPVRGWVDPRAIVLLYG